MGPAAASGASNSLKDSGDDDRGGGVGVFLVSRFCASDVACTDRRSGIDPKAEEEPEVGCRPTSSGGYSTLAKSSSSRDSGSMKIVDCGDDFVKVLGKVVLADC